MDPEKMKEVQRDFRLARITGGFHQKHQANAAAGEFPEIRTRTDQPIIFYYLLRLFGEYIDPFFLTQHLVFYYPGEAKNNVHARRHRNQMYSTMNKKRKRDDDGAVDPKLPSNWWNYFYVLFDTFLFKLPLTARDLKSGLTWANGEYHGDIQSYASYDTDHRTVFAEGSPISDIHQWKSKVEYTAEALFDFYRYFPDFIERILPRQPQSKYALISNAVRNWMRIKSAIEYADTQMPIEDRLVDDKDEYIDNRVAMREGHPAVHKLIRYLFQPYAQYFADRQEVRNVPYGYLTTRPTRFKGAYLHDVRQRVMMADGTLFCGSLEYSDFMSKGKEIVDLILENEMIKNLSPTDDYKTVIEPALENVVLNELAGWNCMMEHGEAENGSEPLTLQHLYAYLGLFVQACMGARISEIVGAVTLFLPVECMQDNNASIRRFGKWDVYVFGTAKSNDRVTRTTPEYKALFDQTRTLLFDYYDQTDEERGNRRTILIDAAKAVLNVVDDSDEIINHFSRPILFDLPYAKIATILYRILVPMYMAEQRVQITNEKLNKFLTRYPSFKKSKTLGGLRMVRRNQLNEIVEENVKCITHTLRGLYATHSFKMNAHPQAVELLWVQDVLGHKQTDFNAAMRYIRCRLDRYMQTYLPNVEESEYAKNTEILLRVLNSRLIPDEDGNGFRVVE